MHQLTVYALALGAAFAESGLGLGAVVPGETFVVVLAATTDGGWAAALLGAVVAVGASLGDHVGYVLGRRHGDRLRRTTAVQRVGVHHLDRATAAMRRHGAAAVVLTRLVPVVRTLTPAAAGASGLPYPRFLAASLTGSALWAGLYVGGGSVAGAAGSAVSDAAGRAAWLSAVAVASLVLPPLVVRLLGGRRPARPAPEVGALERRPAPVRRSATSPLIGDVQL
jgi:membrane protein DedA with SNARE-associated domain